MGFLPDSAQLHRYAHSGRPARAALCRCAWPRRNYYGAAARWPLAIPLREVKKALAKDRAPVEWALDYLWNLPETGPVLSGMSTMQQVEDNLRYRDRAQPGMLRRSEVEMLSRHGGFSAPWRWCPAPNAATACPARWGSTSQGIPGVQPHRLPANGAGARKLRRSGGKGQRLRALRKVRAGLPAAHRAGDSMAAAAEGLRRLMRACERMAGVLCAWDLDALRE